MDARDVIQDDILRQLMYTPPKAEAPSKPPPNDKPISRVQALLSAIDIENLDAFENESRQLTVSEVPGGTISFLFERGETKPAVIDDEVDDVQGMIEA